MVNVCNEVLEVLEVFKESVKLNIPNDVETISRIDKIKEYIEQKED